MKIFNSLKTGFSRSVKSWKGIAIIWIYSLLLVSLVAMPMKNSLKAAFGNSMIADRLASGINTEVYADMEAGFRSLISYFSGGLIMIMLVGFLINAFLSGGLFNNLKGTSAPFSYYDFFRSSVKNFWSFTVITIIISFLIILLAILVIVIPVSIVSQASPSSEGAAFKTFICMTSIFFLILPLLLLVADYARAWQVSQDKNACFKAIGFGFRQIFSTFISSYPMMFFLLIVQFLYGWLVLRLLGGIRPFAETGIVLLFIISQILFFIRIFLKIWRYGSVSGMMELNT
jgi:hypothetical protein